MSQPDFPVAAQRHFDDARHLFSAGRLPNADHLAGFAAECALKAILLEFLGAVLQNGKPSHPSWPNERLWHLDGGKLWGQVGLIARGRTAAQFVSLLAAPNPFTSWDVSDRYSDGATITEPAVRNHINAARDVITVYHQAKLSGTSP